MKLAHPLSLFISPINSRGRACEEVLSRLITENLCIHQFDSIDSLVGEVMTNSAHANRYKLTDVLITEALDPSRIWELQATLRCKSQDAYGWAGQLIVFDRPLFQQYTSDKLQLFTTFGGLLILPCTALLPKLLAALQQRRLLFHGRWSEILGNLNGLSEFWRLLGLAELSTQTSDLPNARLLTREAINRLINDPCNELFFGHRRFNLLKQFNHELPAAGTDAVKKMLTMMAMEMRSFRV